jgi:hypothetical protein
MRKLVCLLALLVLTLFAGFPKATHASTAPAVQAATPSLFCLLPSCDGPYCRGANGCLVCCTH